MVLDLIKFVLTANVWILMCTILCILTPYYKHATQLWIQPILHDGNFLIIRFDAIVWMWNQNFLLSSQNLCCLIKQATAVTVKCYPGCCVGMMWIAWTPKTCHLKQLTCHTLVMVSRLYHKANLYCLDSYFLYLACVSKLNKVIWRE